MRLAAPSLLPFRALPTKPGPWVPPLQSEGSFFRKEEGEEEKWGFCDVFCVCLFSVFSFVFFRFVLFRVFVLVLFFAMFLDFSLFFVFVLVCVFYLFFLNFSCVVDPRLPPHPVMQ